MATDFSKRYLSTSHSQIAENQRYKKVFKVAKRNDTLQRGEQ